MTTIRRIAGYQVETTWHRIRSDSYGTGVDVDTWDQRANLRCTDVEVRTQIPGWGWHLRVRIGRKR